MVFLFVLTNLCLQESCWMECKNTCTKEDSDEKSQFTECLKDLQCGQESHWRKIYEILLND